ncbi:MAG TPA: transporter [Lacunisphaera sp.]
MYRLLQRGALLMSLVAAAAAHGQITETPVTVQPGHFLLEMDALSFSVDRQPGLKYTAFGAATTFLTTGLTSRLDIQLGAELYIRQNFDAAGFTERNSGVGDVYIRTKYRFYESNDTYTAVAVMPYVKIPTNSGGVGNHSVEGGFIVPFSTELVGGFKFNAMGELDFLRNAADNGYDARLYSSAALTRQFFRTVGLYAEATAARSSSGAPWEGTMGAGATLTASKHAWWDFAIYRGLSSGAADWTHVLRFNYGF